MTVFLRAAVISPGTIKFNAFVSKLIVDKVDIPTLVMFSKKKSTSNKAEMVGSAYIQVPFRNQMLKGTCRFYADYVQHLFVFVIGIDGDVQDLNTIGLILHVNHSKPRFISLEKQNL